MDELGAISDRQFAAAVGELRTWGRLAVWRVIWLPRVLLGVVASAAVLITWWQLRDLTSLRGNLDLSIRAGFAP